MFEISGNKAEIKKLTSSLSINKYIFCDLFSYFAPLFRSKRMTGILRPFSRKKVAKLILRLVAWRFLRKAQRCIKVRNTSRPMVFA